MVPYNKKENSKEFRGFYVDVTKSGGDAIKAFRKLKRMYKNTRYFEEMRDRQYYQKPSEIKRETAKRKKQALRKLQKSRDDLLGVKRNRKK